MSNNLFYTIGLPRSGKSSLAERWLKFQNYIEDGQFRDYPVWLTRGFNGNCEIKDHDIQTQHRAVVSGDAIRESLGNLWNPDVEDYVDAIKYTMVKALLKTGHTVLIDETNTSERSIRKILEIDINAQFAFVDTSIEDCLLRAKPELRKPIERMADNLRDLVIPYQDLDEHFLKIVVNRETISKAIQGIKELLIYHKENYTNGPIRDTTAENTKLPKVPPISKPSRADETCCWSYTSPIVPEPGFQVY